ncbi:MAG: primosomal protein N' [Candidatus Gastranaerophilaceae bacterium]
MIFADIIVDISHEKLDRPFQYIIPESLEDKILIGSAVKIPFGKGNRIIPGYVIGITELPSWEVDKMKEILSVEEKKITLESELIQIAWFIRETCGATMNQALKTVIPVKSKTKEIEKAEISLAQDYQTPEKWKELLEHYQKKHAAVRIRLVEALMKQTVLNQEYVKKVLKISSSVLKEMEKGNIITVKRTRTYRNPLTFLDDYRTDTDKDVDVSLNEGQKQIVESICSDSSMVHLIHGITGSGKTRIYMELIRRTLLEGKQAIIMIPEISLTYQTVKRFFDVFGERVSIIHSRLSPGERYDQLERARHGDIDIMIGPRSAVFTPFSNIGVIIIDEEHESSYKSETIPKYHARETAIFRAGLHHARVILGSATPSVESYYKALHGEYRLHTLSFRASGAVAQVSVADLRAELEAGNKSIFSRRLASLIEDRLAKKEQIMLFLNRRGYAGFVNCRKCGEVLQCPHCDISLTYHNGERLTCHYCGYTTRMPQLCPSCHSRYIAPFGTGTEKVEALVHKQFPSARVLRMDADTTAAKGSHERILSQFAAHQADILIGTQMIVKGHDFPLVTLVGIIAADLSLYAQDYRASERTFQLLTQAIGRAGRKSDHGEAVIQTYHPENYSIVAASRQDYKEFYNQEILYRTISGYPPVMQMMAILITSDQIEDGRAAGEWLKTELEHMQEADCHVIGPVDAGIFKLKDRYRTVLYLKHSDIHALTGIKNRLELKLKTCKTAEHTDIYFDLNPMTGY